MDYLKEYMNSIGFDFPTSQKELDNFEENYTSEEPPISMGLVDPYKILKNLKQTKAKLSKKESFFRRAVLAAEITNRCYAQKTFGSVKFQKLLFLCEQVSSMNLQTNYSKQAAGPFDNKFMHGIRQEFKKQEWFLVEKEKGDNYYKVNYTPLNKVDNYKKYYTSYYSKDDTKIQYIIDLFLHSYTKDVELVATIFFCWQEIIYDKSIFSEKLIIKLFYEWAKEKKKFSKQEIIDKIAWMRVKGVIPTI